jgi:hypothetical protein
MPLPKPYRGLAFWAGLAQLRGVQGEAKVILDAGRERLHVGAGIGHSHEFLHPDRSYAYIGILRAFNWNRPMPAIDRVEKPSAN